MNTCGVYLACVEHQYRKGINCVSNRDIEKGIHPGIPITKELDYLNRCMIFDYDIIGNYYIGSHRMLFGTRVRAGKLFEPVCDIDICCGEQTIWLQVIKRLYMLKMRSNLKKNVPIFEELCYCTEHKPVYNDVDFIHWLGNLSQEMGEEFKFTISYNEDHKSKVIKCHRCGMSSYSAGDIEHLYCGKCEVFHITGKRRVLGGLYG